ncbi:MAG: DNA translocase FtsK 4TM domain-containing protein [Patescibacteria group bacterium]
MGRKRKFPKHRQKKPNWYQRENQWGDFVFDWTFGLSGETRRIISGVLILLLSIIIILGFFSSAGVLGEVTTDLAKKLFGSLGSSIFSVSILYLSILLILPPKSKKGEASSYRISKFIGLFLFVIAVPALAHLFIAQENAQEFANYGKGGGLVGYHLSNLLRNGIGLFPSFLFSIFLIVIALLMIFDFSLLQYLGFVHSDEDEDSKEKVNINGARVSVFESLKRKMNGLKHKDRENETKAEVIEVDTNSFANVRRDTTWEYPSLDILKDSDEAPNPGNISKNVEIIQKCLKTFGVEISMSDVNVGPTVSQYTFKPEEGVKLNQIIARQTDLALALSAKSLRLEAPIPGKSSVGVEIPNKIPAKVTLKEILKEKEFKALKSKLAVALGRDVSGDPMSIDLEKMPHLLIAGSTGSGKSVCINSLICSLLFSDSPNDLKILLVDPKRVELTNYNGIPHLLTPVITEVDKTVSALKWAVWEMERRYRMFSEQGKRNIVAYNSSPGEEGKLPYIVIIIDELADLMATSAKEVEGSIVRLAQMARATGMHLVIATQRPSVDVLTGLIKANITSRIAFATASQVDSRTILDLSGAEKLLGNGDMLFIGNGVNKPKRIQGCFVSDGEIEELNKFLREKGEVEYDDAILSFRSPQSGGTLSGDGSGEDDLYNDAVETVINAGKASASLLQRRLRVGYARAARLLDILEQQGVIGPADGAKPRDVLISDTGSQAFQNNGNDFSDYPENNNNDRY